MKRTDVLVIGGSAAGIVAAITAKSNYPKKKCSTDSQGRTGFSSMWDSIHIWLFGQYRKKYYTRCSII